MLGEESFETRSSMLHYVANDTTSGIPQQQIAVARDEYVPRDT